MRVRKKEEREREKGTDEKKGIKEINRGRERKMSIKNLSA